MAESSSYLSIFFAHDFKDDSLLSSALQGLVSRDNAFQRLEFLGDRVLGLAMADLLCEMFPEESEGDLAKRHGVLVSGSNLRLLVDARLHDFFVTEARKGHASKEVTASLQEDVLEALLAVIYLESGFAAVREAVRHIYRKELARQQLHPPPNNAKSALQEWALQRALPLPSYRTISRMGESHKPTFTIEVSVGEGERWRAFSMGPSKGKAEQIAAKLLLEKLQAEEQQ